MSAEDDAQKVGREYIEKLVNEDPDVTEEERKEDAEKQSLVNARTSYYANHMLAGQKLFDLPKPEPLINGLFDLESLVFLYGEPKSFKSFLAIDWALSVAHGLPWNGHEVTQQKVLYVAGEGASGIPERIKAWMKVNTPMATAPVDDFMLIRVPVPMGSAIDSDAISGLAVIYNVKFVILDTLARCAAGMDENSSKDMGTLVANADKIKQNSGATVMFVHHSGKGNKNDLRGSSALLGAADSVFRVKKKAQEGVITLENSEQKNHEEARPLSFIVEKVADSVVLKCMNKLDTLDDKRRTMLSHLTTATMAAGGPIKLAEWGRACDVPDVGNAKWFREGRTKLVNAGLVIEEEGLFRVAS